MKVEKIVGAYLPEVALAQKGLQAQFVPRELPARRRGHLQRPVAVPLSLAAALLALLAVQLTVFPGLLTSGAQHVVFNHISRRACKVAFGPAGHIQFGNGYGATRCRLRDGWALC